MIRKTFNFVVARPWHFSNPDNLCIYSYRTETQNGTLKEATDFLDYVKNVHRDEPELAEQYSIYKVNYEKI